MLDSLPDDARTLIGFWLGRGRVSPARHATSWMRSGSWPSSFWGEYARARIAAQVVAIRHWRVIEGDYTAAPDIRATWFIDPPYVSSRDYLASVDDYDALGCWCRARRGLAIVCEQAGAAWLPFRSFRAAKSIARRSYDEVAWVQREAVNGQLESVLS